jgi:hypothetical protein
MVSAFALSQARTIVRYAPELADRVVELEGMRFSDAFEHETRARRSGRRKTSIIGGGSGETLRARSDPYSVQIWGPGSVPIDIQKLQTALHAKAKAEPGYRFSALYDKISREDILAHAYAQCRSNKGAPGVDRQDFEGCCHGNDCALRFDG